MNTENTTEVIIHMDYHPDGSNTMYSIDDLPLDQSQKELVLEWFARKLWVLLEEGSGQPEYYGKMYDPLVIEGNVAHSYVFNLEDGGRHHEFTDLAHLEKMLMKEGIDEIRMIRMAMGERED